MAVTSPTHWIETHHITASVTTTHRPNNCNSQDFNNYLLLAYRGADKSLARPTSRCILFDGENILFDASLVIYISSTVKPA